MKQILFAALVFLFSTESFLHGSDFRNLQADSCAAVTCLEGTTCVNG